MDGDKTPYFRPQKGSLLGVRIRQEARKGRKVNRSYATRKTLQVSRVIWKIAARRGLTLSEAEDCLWGRLIEMWIRRTLEELVR